MSPAQPSLSDRTAPCGDPAILHLRRGTYVAEWAVLSHGVVSFAGRRRERDLLGERLYPARRESVSLAAGERVEWIDAGHEMADTA
jgi:hypothetical protein